MKGRRGFTLVELLITMAVVAILANLALLMLRGFRENAEAARIVADLRTVNSAGFDYSSDNAGAFPSSAGWGSVPAALAPYLPDGFSFTNAMTGGSVQYRWWNKSGGSPGIGAAANIPDQSIRDLVIAAQPSGTVVGGNWVWQKIE